MDTLNTQEFFRQVNAAFFSGDKEFMENIATDDVVWTMVGNEPIHGKQAFLDAAFGIGGYTEMVFDIDLVIANDTDAVVKGTMKMPEKAGGTVKTYAFCDFYRLERGSTYKIKEMTTFVIELKQ